MGNFQFIWQYVGSCLGDQLPSGECAPLWQFGIIILLLVFAVAVLIFIRVMTADDPRPLPARTPRPRTRKQ
ncbi:MAG: hypothetical protein OEP48_09955 [Betaproteobacteria bacterium]|nr:hypothetical protein [Betaproteobacteria bacterium]